MVDTNEDSVESETIDLEKIKKLKITNNQYLIIVAFVCIFLGFMIGQQVGYTQGYAYVDNWHDNYISRFCVCSNTSQNNYLKVPQDLDIDISDYIE